MNNNRSLDTMVPTKYLLCISGLFLATVSYQVSFSPRTLDEDAIFDGNVYENRRPENRTPPLYDEFWLTASDMAILPFDVDFEGLDDSYGTIQPAAYCNEHNATEGGSPTKIIFSHVVRTEASWVQDFLSAYASSCHAGFVSTAICSGLSWESMMKGPWSNRKVQASKGVIRCPMIEARQRTGEKIKGQRYVHTDILEEYVDVLAGQVPLGSHEQWKNSKKKIVDAQYIVSLRSPSFWLISNVMDQVKRDRGAEGSSLTADVFAEAVNEKVESSLANNMYHEVYARYLISPSQISWIQKEEADLDVDHRVDLSLRNLMETNALIIITEEMEDSVEKLRSLVDPNGDRKDLVERLLKETRPEPSSATISVESVLQALKEDESRYQRLQEYLKYETKIYDKAKEMHQLQLSWVRKTRSVP